jgi:ADP-heptose:LPS heptosyltransferase
LKKVLVIRFSSIGDIILTSPVLRNLSKNGFEVHFITKKNFISLVDENPYIHKIWTYEQDVENPSKDFTETSFDWIVDLHHNIRSKKTRALFPNTFTTTIDKQNFKKALLVTTKSKAFGVSHVTDRSLDCIRQNNIKVDHLGLDFFLKPIQKLNTAELPSKFLAFVIGGQHRGKMMSEQRMETLFSHLKIPIFLVGGPDDAEKGKRLAEKFDHVHNTAGKLSIHDSAHLLKFSQAVLSHDTGMMHIATALNKPILSLWGATTPELGFAPYKPNSHSVILEHPHFLRPTSKLGKQTWSASISFIDLIPISTITQAVNKVFSLQ